LDREVTEQAVMQEQVGAVVVVREARAEDHREVVFTVAARVHMALVDQ
jgi:hypothetical protein